MTGLRLRGTRTGRRSIEGNVKDGKPDGFGASWHENGQKKFEGNCQGRQDGTGFGRGGTRTGIRQAEANLKNGKLMTAVVWKPNGEKCPVTKLIKDGNGVVGRYYENGQKDSEGNYNGGKIMTVFVWKPNGEKCPVTKLIDGNGGCG